MQLSEGGGLVRHRAEHEAHDDRVHRLILEREPVSKRVDDADGHRRLPRVTGGALAQVRLRLNRDDLRDGRREVPEVRSVPAPTSTTRPEGPASSSRR